MSSARSWLYVPGNRRDRLESAGARGADALIADLEDSVAPADKPAARESVADWLSQERPAGHEIWVRLNADSISDDLAVLTPAVTGVVVAKAGPQLLDRLDRELAARERAAGLPAGSWRVFALIETAAALREIDRLAAAPRVAQLGLGEADLAAELRLRPGADRAELLPLRLQLVVACAAAGLAAPVGPVSTDFRDLAALRRSTEALLRLGYRGRTAIHPAQVPVINEVFSPSEAEVAEARELVRAFEASGSGVSTDAAGRMVDLAVVRSAREVLERAARGIAG